MSGPHTTSTVGSPRPCFFSRSGGAVYAADEQEPAERERDDRPAALHDQHDHDREAAHVDDERARREALAGVITPDSTGCGEYRLRG